LSNGRFHGIVVLRQYFRRSNFMSACRSAAVRLASSCAALALFAGCAATPLGPTVQVMPGPGKSFDVFQADNASCKGFATDQVKGQADAANQRAVGAAALTTVLGAGLGAATGAAFGNAGAGATIGAAAGASGGSAYGAGNSGNEQYGIQVQYDNAFSQCMYAKGEQVPGYAPVVVPGPMIGHVAVADPVVRATQSELIRLGYLGGGADGFAGHRTHSAIASFQQANGLPPDGVASQRLLAKLQATPTSAPAATASAPSSWVAPAGTPAATPVTASAPAGWVAPTRTP
jgi:hypothetical protein